MKRKTEGIGEARDEGQSRYLYLIDEVIIALYSTHLSPAALQPRHMGSCVGTN
jgi:hypothetical protein